MKSWWFGLVGLLGGCGVYGIQAEPSTDPSSQAPRAMAPEFALLDTNGSIVSLGDRLSGSKLAVLVFYRGHW